MKSRAPGKVILSGEHAVVFGNPALAFAIDNHITSQIIPQNDLSIMIQLNGQPGVSLPLLSLPPLISSINERHISFLNNRLPIQQVIQYPVELIQYIIGYLIELFAWDLKHGFHVTISSNLPLGYGLGASSALILSVIKSFCACTNNSLSEQEVFEHGRQLEHLQHGHSSGLDIKISYSGGCWWQKESVRQPRTLPPWEFYLVNTGKPESSTGECIALAEKQLEKEYLLTAFSETTSHLDHGLIHGDYLTVIEQLKINHLLLCHLGVVPDLVKHFIIECEKNNFAGKICGAGACRGNNGGFVLLLGKNNPALICKKYSFSCQPVKVDLHGLQSV